MEQMYASLNHLIKNKIVTLASALGALFLIVAPWISDFFFLETSVMRQDIWLFTRYMSYRT